VYTNMHKYRIKIITIKDMKFPGEKRQIPV